MHQVEVLLVVDVLEFGVPQTDHRALVVEAVFATGKVEAVGGEGRPAVHRHVFHARVIARAVAAELPGIQGQAGDFLGGDLPAAEGLRQRAAVVRTQNRQHRHPFTNLQFGVGDLRFQCHAETAEIVGRAPVIVHRQQVCARRALAAIELDRVQAQYIDTEADQALGKAGAGVEDEALGPFLGLALRVGRVDEVAVDVEIAQVEAGLGVLDKAAFGREGGQGASHGQQAGKQVSCGCGCGHRLLSLVFM
ncbi:hypothetical protein D3C80_1242670 [compost metagenome]